VFERFTDKARRAVVLAQEHAHARSAAYIDSALLAAGILDAEENLRNVFAALALDSDEWRDTLLNVTRQPSKSNLKHLPFTVEAKAVLEFGLREALQSGANYVGVLHLFLGLLRQAESGKADRIPLPNRLTRDSVLQVMITLGMQDAPSLSPLVQPLGQSVPELVLTQFTNELSVVAPGYISDAAHAPDCLSFQSSVDMLASVITARDAHPPLSIGLFARWGAGKSFFLDLLQDRVELLSRASQAAVNDGRETYYCTSVRQITFNAWHYADANLWASLASHLFEQLALDPDSKSEGERRVSLIEQLGSARMLLTELERAKTERDHVRSRLAGLGSLFDAKTARAALGQAVDTELGEGFRSIEKLAGSILPDQPSVDDIIEIADDLRTTGSSLRTTWHWLGGVRGRLLRMGALSVLTLFAVALYLVITSRIGRGLAVTATAIMLTLAEYVALIRVPLRRVRNASKGLALVSRRLNDEREAERARIQAELDQARSRVESLAQQLDDLRSGRQFARLVAERHASGAYARHLGLVSEIRRDFEEMAALLQRGDDDRLRVERVVLYIDDLDRCPSARVAEVLEAVHLLLALPLFVVVVAVDPRWLVRSLESQHVDALSGGGVGGATPGAYLEKIFQIAYNLPAMDHQGFGSLISTLMASCTGMDEDAEGEASSSAPMNLVADSGTVAPGYERHIGPAVIDDVTPVALRVTPAETEYMGSLGSLVTTPRAAKRLVNVYRLIRAGIMADHIPSYISTGEYMVVLILAAILVGMPSAAAGVFDYLLSKEGTVNVAADGLSGTLSDLDMKALSEVLRHAAKRGSAAAAVVTYQHWIPQVRRLSFTPIS
jgi:hypothetical protein